MMIWPLLQWAMKVTIWVSDIKHFSRFGCWDKSHIPMTHCIHKIVSLPVDSYLYVNWPLSQSGSIAYLNQIWLIFTVSHRLFHKLRFSLVIYNYSLLHYMWLLWKIAKMFKFIVLSCYQGIYSNLREACKIHRYNVRPWWAP